MHHADFLHLTGEVKWNTPGSLKQAEVYLKSAMRFKAHSLNVFLLLARVLRVISEKAKNLYSYLLLKIKLKRGCPFRNDFDFRINRQRFDAMVPVTRKI